MRLNEFQIKMAAKFFADLGKIWFASGVIGFFIPEPTGKLGIGSLVGGILASFSFLLISMAILKSK